MNKDYHIVKMAMEIKELTSENKELKEMLSDAMMILSDNCGDDGDNYQTIDKLENLLFPELKGTE